MSTKVKVLTKEQAFLMAKNTGLLVTVVNVNRALFIFTDRHQVPEQLKNDPNWIPITQRFPISVVPRAGVEDGVVDTYEKYKLVFEKENSLVENLYSI